MIIKSISIENYRCFKGVNKIEFNTDGKITLIYGPSGAGKTTLLHFINWVFYGENPFTSDETYNSKLVQELEKGKEFKVEGIIEFDNDETSYKLIRTITFVKHYIDAKQKSISCQLLYKDTNGSWKDYPKNIPNKINAIIPKALSKYFFFKGEESLNLEVNGNVYGAIQKMFGLDKYTEAINHLTNNGTFNSKYSVLNRYKAEINSIADPKLKESLDKINSDLAIYKEKRDGAELELSKKKERLRNCEIEYDEKINIIGDANKSDELRNMVDQLKVFEDNCENDIKKSKADFSSKMINSVPYLLVANKTKYAKELLQKYADEEITYESLNRKLLQDILNKKTCVCGNCITEKEQQFINKIIDSMPPHSYKYTYNSFSHESERKYEYAQKDFEECSVIVKEIAKKYNEINELNENIHEYTTKLEALKDTEEYAKRCKELKAEINKLTERIGVLKQYIDQYNNKITINEHNYNKKARIDKNTKKFTTRIEIVNQLVGELKMDLLRKTESTRNSLEESIRNVYRKISTRNDMDDENKKFLSLNFSLRNEYKTGGQEVIDIYSYVIGMINALKNVSNETNDEYPIVIDAPFSKTDETQMAHVLDVLPDICKQVALFTFDVQRIKLNCNLEKIGRIWIIDKNSDQTISTIKEAESSWISRVI